MIYRVLYDGVDIHTNSLPDVLINPTVETEMNTAGSFSFTLPPDHFAWGDIEVFKGNVDVYENDELIFFGRVANVDQNWNNERIVECEGALAFFNDSVQRPNSWTSNTLISQFLSDILDAHNAQVPDNRKIYLGNVTIDDMYVTRETNYEKTLDVLTRMCIDTNGGYFSLRKDEDDGKIYLDWLKDLTDIAAQPVEFGLNLLDISKSLHAEDIVTGVLARGAEVNDVKIDLHEVGEIDDPSSPVIHHTNLDPDILWHREGLENFGRVVRVKEFNDCETVDGDNGLLAKATEWLVKQNTDVDTIEVDAAELGYFGESYPIFLLGQKVTVNSTPHGLSNVELPMYKISMNLDSGTKRISIGTPPKRELTQISASNMGGGSGSGSSSGGGSGSGGVQDVRVNGTSVVQDGIARVNVPTDTVTESEMNTAINTAVSGKANQSDLESLATAVAGKADTSTVNALATVVASKQDNLVFNSQDAATAHLTKIKNGNEVYDIPTGTTVVANPTGEATSDLTKLKVGDDIYRIPSGGGGSGDHLDGTDDPSLGIGSDGDVYFKRSGAVPGGIELKITNLKLKVTRNRDRNNGMVQYSKLRFFDESDNEYSWPSGVTWSSDVIVYENDPIGSSKILQVNNPGTLTLNLPSGAYIDTSIYTKYGWYTANDQPGRDPVSWELYVSENGVDYILIDERTEQTITTNRKALAFRDEYNTQPPIDLPNITDIFLKKNGLWIKENFVNEEELEDAIEEAKFNNLTMTSDYYSEDEQVVGRWTDGKPLYQKTGSIIITANTSNWTLVDNLDNYDYLVSGYGTFYEINGTNRDYIPHYSGRTPEPRLCVRNDHKLYYYYNSYSGNNRTYVYDYTIQYTKTTDAPGTGPTKGNLIYLPALYSEEEREVGVWTDGKPLYQKTYKNIGVTLQQNTWTNTGIPFTGVDHWEVIFNKSTSNYDNQYPMFYRFYNGNFEAFCQYTMPLDELTLQYTKTTDQPGSATWTPEGQLAHHYSTSEKVVGTWIDGSTVYERTWDFGSNVTFPSNTWTNTNIDASNISKIINVQTSNTGGDCFSFEARCASTYIQLNHWRGNNSGIDIRYLTLQYTKSS